MGEGVSGCLQGHCRIGGFGKPEEAFVKEWLRETMRKLLLRAALEAGRERKCEGDGSRAALPPLSLPLVTL